METKTYSLQYLANYLGAKVVGDPTCQILGIGSLSNATSGQISFLENPHYKKFLAATGAAAVLVREEFLPELHTSAIVVANPYLAYAKISKLFDDAPAAVPGIHPSAIIGKECEIDPSVSIAAHCVIGDKVKLGKNVQIGAGCVVSDESIIDENSKLFPRVVLYHKVSLGKRVIVHSGAIIGSDGFGNANERGIWHKIYQLGKVIIGNDVEIGANTTIDRGAIEDTIIEDGVRLDNQIQIGHNVRIGAHTAIAGCVGIAGSAKIGRHCMIGGGVGINGHIEITDGVIVTGMSSVGQSITTPGVYSCSLYAMPQRNWWRIFARLTHIEDLVRRVTALEKK